jgi:hypothetical protein
MIMTLSKTFSIMSLSIMALSIMTLSIMTINMAINMTMRLSTITLS